MELSARIAAWREAKGLSRQQLADAVGVSVAAVYQWEGTGESKTNPTHENLAHITGALGITLSRFWGPVPKPKGSTAKVAT